MGNFLLNFASGAMGAVNNTLENEQKQKQDVDKFRQEELIKMNVLGTLEQQKLSQEAANKKQLADEQTKARLNNFGYGMTGTSNSPPIPQQIDWNGNQDINNSNSTTASSAPQLTPLPKSGAVAQIFNTLPDANTDLSKQITSGNPSADAAKLPTYPESGPDALPHPGLTSSPQAQSTLPPSMTAGAQAPAQPQQQTQQLQPISNEDAYHVHTQIAALAYMNNDKDAAEAHKLLADQTKAASERQEKNRDALLKNFDDTINKNVDKAGSIPILVPRAALKNPEAYNMKDDKTVNKEKELSTNVAQPLLASILNEHIKTNPDSLKDASSPVVQDVVKQTQNIALIVTHAAPLEQRQEAAKNFVQWANTSYNHRVISKLQPGTPNYDANLASVITPDLVSTIQQLSKPLPSSEQPHGVTAAW